MKIRLTEEEMRFAASIGINRHISCLLKGKSNSHGLDPHDLRNWDMHIEGAAGELAAAKAIGVPWDATVDTFKSKADLGERTQVRRRSDPNYDLIIRKDDNEEHSYILVTGNMPNFIVVGWIFGYEAKRDCWLRAYGGREQAYFVPQRELLPVYKFWGLNSCA